MKLRKITILASPEVYLEDIELKKDIHMNALLFLPNLSSYLMYFYHIHAYFLLMLGIDYGICPNKERLISFRQTEQK